MRISRLWTVLVMHPAFAPDTGVAQATSILAEYKEEGEATEEAREALCTACQRAQRVGLQPKKGCPDCKFLREAAKAESEEKPKTKRRKGKERQPGDDTEQLNPWHKQVERSQALLEVAITEASEKLVVDKTAIQALRQRLADLITRFVELVTSANPRPVQAPTKGECRDCLAEVLWVTTPKGKRIMLAKANHGGKWDIVNNVATYLKEPTGPYRRHFCPGMKERKK